MNATTGGFLTLKQRQQGPRKTPRKTPREVQAAGQGGTQGGTQAGQKGIQEGACNELTPKQQTDTETSNPHPITNLHPTSEPRPFSIRPPRWMKSLYRPLTDNDRPKDGAEWINKRLHEMKVSTRSVEWHASGSAVKIVVVTRAAPPALEWSIDATTTYTFFGAGGINIYVKGKPQVINVPTTLARVGLTMSLAPGMEQVTWFGRGPGESYRDKKLSQLFGTYTKSVDELWTEYEFPQESGNRTDVRWVTVSDGKAGGAAMTARFGKQEGFSFQASHYSTEDVDRAQHPFELHRKKRIETILRLDAMHHGLGTGSCGPKTLDEHALKSGPFEFGVDLE